MSATYLESLFSLRGRVALVSGASRGIGMAIARGLEKAGASVVGIGSSAAPAEAPTGNLSYERCDVVDNAGFRSLCEMLHRKHDGLHIYFHAAAISLTDGASTDADDNFDRTIDINLKEGLYLACKNKSILIVKVIKRFYPYPVPCTK